MSYEYGDNGTYGSGDPEPSGSQAPNNVQSDNAFAVLIDAARGFERKVAAANKEGMSITGIATLTGIDPHEIGSMIDRAWEFEKEHP